MSFEKYADHCIDLIFKNNIMLYECKRLKTEEDRNKLKDIKRLIFNNEPILNIIENILDGVRAMRYAKTTLLILTRLVER